MTMIRVALPQRSYPIYVENSYARLPGYLRRLRVPSAVVIISHRALLARFGRQLVGPLRRAGFTVRTIEVPESERTKSYEMVERVIRRLAPLSAMRVPLLLACGGGVVGDLTGFVAAVFRRGIPYVQLPTTLLAQVDSAIGGKVGVDVPFAKNMVGSFYQPRLVFNQVGVLTSLPVRQRRSGLSEIVKYAVIADPMLFRFMEGHVAACLAGHPQATRFMIERCCRIKARIVARDERETTGLRTQLNFGHTLGHALEAATAYRRFTHGEAIAIGMAAAARLSVRLGRMSEPQCDRMITLLARLGLPTRSRGVRLAAVKRALRHDKKFVGGKARWVLPSGIGRVVVSDAIPSEAMWQVIRDHVSA